ncbi:hypothetical protein VST7929_00005 [Vibrio stylophorae]|uniref:F0F1 ATP synthase subunit I n=1 Tax=Vibrio stylophorae TaxID=659351 RepID=A0ABM8ZQ33_9VIBR|nr:ATP synthase subunit I [Vibrio stylophorae]CAH0532194.1 hypothetical protein VST7929_00005 [Vibrio stylophorae]
MRRELTLVYITFTIQVILLLVSGGLWAWAYDPDTGYSAIVGGGAHCIPYLVASLVMLVHRADQSSAAQLATDVYIGIGVKWGLTAILLVLVFVFYEIHLLVFYAGYVLSLLVQWAVSFTFNNRY